MVRPLSHSLHLFVAVAILITLTLTLTITITTALPSPSAASTSSSLATPLSTSPLPHVRPAKNQRKFNSDSVERLIVNITSRMASVDLATLFENCWPNTLDTTVESFTAQGSDPLTQPPDAFIVTGDIHAQWFRDSTNQLMAYATLIGQDENIRQLTCGLINRQTRNVLHDPFANAFNFNASGSGHQDDIRQPPMTAEVFEGKYELDSLAAVMKLAHTYWKETKDPICFLKRQQWSQAMRLIISTIKSMQVATTTPSASPYRFQRLSTAPTESQMLSGMGSPTAYTGMSRSPFRPSDDSTLLPFLIPAQAMTVVELTAVSQMIEEYLQQEVKDRPIAEWSKEERDQADDLKQIASDASSLASEIDNGIHEYGIVSSRKYGDIFAYEVDGFGGTVCMDDANIPSLLSLPYLGYLERSSPLYQSTRRYVWSAAQPYFFEGQVASGIGGPHEGINMIWPMSLIVYALTSQSDEEIKTILQQLIQSSAGTGWLHESFDKDYASLYTRSWFSWVNGLYGELILQLAKERPHLIFNYR